MEYTLEQPYAEVIDEAVNNLKDGATLFHAHVEPKRYVVGNGIFSATYGTDSLERVKKHIDSLAFLTDEGWEAVDGIGLWVEDGRIYVDTITTTDTLREAELIGRTVYEISFYDRKKNQVIYIDYEK